MNCPEIYGDEIARTVAWRNNAHLDKAARQAIRLRIALRDADLFSLRFVRNP